jgi:hypothetical protein
MEPEGLYSKKLTTRPHPEANRTTLAENNSLLLMLHVAPVNIQSIQLILAMA